MALVELVACDDRFEAALIQSRLEAAGIVSFLFDAEMSWIGGALRARVMVDEDDLAPAHAVLNEPPADRP
jgi:hypothetical protein